MGLDRGLLAFPYQPHSPSSTLPFPAKALTHNSWEVRGVDAREPHDRSARSLGAQPESLHGSPSIRSRNDGTNRARSDRKSSTLVATASLPVKNVGSKSSELPFWAKSAASRAHEPLKCI